MRLAPARHCVGLLAILGAVATGCTQPAAGGPPFRADDAPSEGASYVVPGMVGMGVIGRLYVDAPFTVRRLRAFRVDPEVEILGFRAAFYGRGITPSGHRAEPGYLSGSCTRSWPFSGFGPTYPVEGLTVTAGDDLTFIVYFRSHAPGRRSVQGFRVDYQTPDGRQGSAHGDANTLVNHVDRDPRLLRSCGLDKKTDTWTMRLPGYPS